MVRVRARPVGWMGLGVGLRLFRRPGNADQSSAVLTRDVISKRNSLALQKHKVDVRCSVLNPAVGLGLYAKQQLPKAFSIPAKGKFFGTIGDALAHAATFTTAKFHECVIQVHYQDEKGSATPCTWWLLVTGVVRFINSFQGVGHAANCELVAWPEHGLGDHCVAVRTLRRVGKGQELLLDYGSSYPLPTIAAPIAQPMPPKVARRSRAATCRDMGGAKRSRADTPKKAAAQPPARSRSRSSSISRKSGKSKGNKSSSRSSSA